MSVKKRPHLDPKKFSWCYEFRLNRKKYAVSGYLSEKAAKEAEAKKLGELKSKRARPIENDKVSLEQFVPKFIAHRRVVRSEETAIREERRARPIIKVFGQQRLMHITVSDIFDYVARRQKDGLQNRSINLEITLLRSLYHYAIKCHFASENPATEVEFLKQTRSDKWCPSVDEVILFIEMAKKTASAGVLVPWLWFRVYTGTRPKESVFVEWTDIDFQNDRIRIRPKPGNTLKNEASNRYLDLHPELKPILLEWKAKWDEVFAKRHERHPDEPHPPHNWVFFNPHDQDARATSFFKCFYQARKAAGLPEMTSHTLRHFFISQAVMSGVELLTIARWVGHNGTAMIEKVYGHLRPKYRQEQMSRVSIVVTPSGTGSNGNGEGKETK